MNTDEEYIRSLLNEAFSYLGINYANKTVQKPVTKKILVKLVENEFELNLNERMATECLLFCKTIDDKMLNARESTGFNGLSILNTEFDLDRFALWLSQNIPRMKRIEDSRFHLPVESARLNQQLDDEFRSKTSEILNYPDQLSVAGASQLGNYRQTDLSQLDSKSSYFENRHQSVQIRNARLRNQTIVENPSSKRSQYSHFASERPSMKSSRLGSTMKPKADRVSFLLDP